MLQLFPDGRRLAAGYDDGAVKIWDLKTSSLVSQVPANVQGLRVTAIDVQPDNNLVAALSFDGNYFTPFNVVMAILHFYISKYQQNGRKYPISRRSPKFSTYIDTV